MIKFNNFNTSPKLNFRAAQPVNNPYLGEKQNKDSFQLSVGYINDTHGQVNNQLRIISGLQGDIRLSAGDDQIGSEKNHATNAAAVNFLNAAKILARAMGNHEMDTTTQDFCNLNKKNKAQLLAINFSQWLCKFHILSLIYVPKIVKVEPLSWVSSYNTLQ